MTETEILRQIVQKQDELIQNFKDWCKVKSIHDEVTATEIAKQANELIKELASLRQQLEKAQNKPLSHDEAQELESKMGF